MDKLNIDDFDTSDLDDDERAEIEKKIKRINVGVGIFNFGGEVLENLTGLNFGFHNYDDDDDDDDDDDY